MDFRVKFIEDAGELLSDIEKTLLQLEDAKTNSALIEEAFRAMHTLKGSAAMYGFKRIGDTTHNLENIFDLIRNGRLTVSIEVLDLALKAVDFLNSVLNDGNEDNFTSQFDTLAQKTRKILEDAGKEFFDGNKKEIENIENQLDGEKTVFITIVPDEDIRNRGIKIHQIFDKFSKLGKNRVFHRVNQQKTGPGVFWEIFLGTEMPLDEIDDILIFIDDISQVKVIANKNLFESHRFDQKLTEIATLEKTDIEELKKWIENLHEEVEQEKQSEIINARNSKTKNVRVASERLDEQMSLLSELVTVNSELQMIVNNMKIKELTKTVEQIDKISRRFRTNILKIRLIPIESLKLRFERLIRDISVKLNKNVEFVTEGLQTELDKTIADSLEQPLMHLLRNALDHGIEAPDIRKSRNKSEIGMIRFTARQSAANIYISVEDDGEGIDVEKIRQKAIEKKIITKDNIPDKDELLKLIFAPGFSTARSLTDVSGRGVGMDFVRETIQNLRGAIDIKTERSKGTKFIIRLPLSLSIIDTMLVKAGKSYFSIPLTAIDKCSEIKANELNRFDNTNISIDGQLVPYIYLKTALGNTTHAFFGTQIQNSESESNKDTAVKLVIINYIDYKVALIVDEVIGQHQAVLKQLGHYFLHHQHISGATQLANGKIAIVIDPERLVERYAKNKHK